MQQFHILLVTIFTLMVACQSEKREQRPPNIVYILADDLGIGDLSCYNADSKIKTVNLDRLATAGMRFTDAHSGSAVCTPTRYGILTGRYAWRTHLQNGVLWSYSEPLIPAHQPTVANLLKSAGYRTACIGKWHLGLGWEKDSLDKVDFYAPITGGPNANGFDYFFGITASLDIPPYFYIRNDRITATTIDTIAAMTGKKFWREGPIGNDFTHEEVLPRLTKEAVSYIEEQQQSDEPFFLYFPLPAPHTPILPTDAFAGQSGTNAYGDFVLMVDDVVGQIRHALEKTGAWDETMLIFTSDNGCSPMADFAELDSMGHDPSYIYRGHKADIFEGGHRIPFLVSWPERIKSGVSHQTTCLTDLMATAAAIIQQEVPNGAGQDSYSLLSVLLGDADQQNLREATVHHSINGSFALRKGQWKMVFCPGSGGWSDPRPGAARNLELPPAQLFNILEDPGETTNLIDARPEVKQAMTQLMQRYIDEGRSTPGFSDANDVEVILLK